MKSKLTTVATALRRLIDMVNKRGSYILEAAMSLPVLILCISALVLVIRIVMICEGICFATAAEIKEIIPEAYRKIPSVSLCKDVEDSVLREEALTDFKVTRFRYLYSRGDMEDLISIESKAGFKVANAVGIKGEIEFEVKLLVRGFTGTRQEGTPLEEGAFCDNSSSRKVFIFPKYGIRYHTRNCRYVKQNHYDETCKIEMEKEDAGRKGYTPCLVCGGAANV